VCVDAFRQFIQYTGHGVSANCFLFLLLTVRHAF
jgi:hypothetical protein